MNREIIAGAESAAEIIKEFEALTPQEKDTVFKTLIYISRLLDDFNKLSDQDKIKVARIFEKLTDQKGA